MSNETPVIMIVDDELKREMKSTVDRMKSRFKDYTIISSLTLEKAKHDFETHKERIRVIVLDIRLDGSKDDAVAGLDFGRFVRLTKKSDVPIVVYTNWTSDVVSNAFKDIKITEIMHKEGPSEELVKKIRQLLAIQEILGRRSDAAPST